MSQQPPGNIDSGVVLDEPRDVTPAKDRHPELLDPVGQRPLDVVLEEPERVVVAGGEVADVQGDPGEPRDLGHLPPRKEPIGDSTLIEHLDGA